MNSAGSSGDSGDRPRFWLRLPRWARIVLWVDATVGAVVVLAATIAIVLVYSPSLHGYLIRLAQKQVEEQLGLHLHLQNFAVHASQLSVDLYGISVDGAETHPSPPVLQVQHVRVSARILSVLERTWYLQDLEIDRPVVQVYVDKNGVSNIPKINSSGSGNQNTVFDLGIRHAALKDGAVFYNDKPAPVAADLADLDFRSAFDGTKNMYVGKLGYSGGSLRYGEFNPSRHRLDVSFRATPSEFDLTPFKLGVDGSELTLFASAKDYNNPKNEPKIDARYDAMVDGAGLRAILKNAYVPSGVFRTAGTVELYKTDNVSWLQALKVSGWLGSHELDLDSPQLHASIRNLVAQYSFANGAATVPDFRADTLGGTVAAGAEMTGVGSARAHTNIRAQLNDVSLQAVQRAIPRSAAIKQLAVTGKMDATASAAWGNTIADLVAHADVAAAGEAASGARAAPAATHSPVPAVLPLQSAIHATYNRKKQEIALDSSFVRAGQTELTMNGTAGRKSSVALRVQVNDLSEVATMANLFRSPAPGGQPSELDLAGRATFEGNVSGAMDWPRLTGQLMGEDLRWNGTTWRVLRTGVDVSPSRLGLMHAQIEPAGAGQITLSGAVGLKRWHFERTNPVEVDLNISEMTVGELMKVAGQQFPADGVLNANVRLRGSLDSPQGNGTMTLTKASVYQQPMQAVHLNFTGTGNEVRTNFSTKLVAGSVRGQATIRPREKTYTAQVTSDGIRLQDLELLQAKKMPLAGIVLLRASGNGSFDNPQVTAVVQAPELAVQKQTLTGLNLQMNLANHVANATLHSTAVNTAIEARAKIELTGDYVADAAVDTRAIPLEPLLAVYAPGKASGVTGEIELHATLRGPLKKRDQLEAQVTISQLKLNYNNDQVQLAAAQPIRADFRSGILTLQPSAIHGTDTDLRFRGSISTAANGPMSLQVLGTVNLALAQVFNPDLRSSGQLKFNINSNGPMSAGAIGGEIDIVDANLASTEMPIGLQHGNGALALTSDRLNIRSFEGTIGGGSVTAQGGVAFRPAVAFDLGVAAKGVRMLYPQGLRETANANLRFAGTMDHALLGGTVDLVDLSFTAGFDMTSFIGQFSSGVAAPPSRGFTQDVVLNINAHTPNNIDMVSRELSVAGSANVQMRGTLADPVLLGRVNLTGGDMILHGDRFVVNGGTVQFVNPTETEPVVNLNLSTTIQQYNINMRFSGPVDQLQTAYTSDPALPTADIINLLAFGQTTETSAANPTPANQAAESMVASQVSGQVTSRVSKIAGISQLSVNPVLAGSSTQGPPGANITIQQRVTGNLFVTFSSNVASTQAQTIQGQYQLSPRVAISATRDPNGGFAVDTLIKKSW